MNTKHFIIAFLLVLVIDYCFAGVFYIGATFDRNKKINAAILEYAVDKANKNILNGSDIELGYTPELLEYGNEFLASESLCRLLDSKAFAIIGPKSPLASSHIASICDAKEIPYIDTYMDLTAKISTINLYPTHQTLSQLLIDVVNAYNWQDVTILYEAPSFIKRIAPLLQNRNGKSTITIVQPLEVGTNFRSVLQKVKDMGSRSTNIIIECSIEYLTEILDQILQVGLFTPDRNFIITNLDAQTIDLEKYQYTRANITIFRIIDPDSNIQEFKNIYDILDIERNKCLHFSPCTQDEMEELSPFVLQTSTALIYDGVLVLAEALRQIGIDHLQLYDDRSINCYDSKSIWDKGYTITNYMKNSNYTGLTRMIDFDTKGLRSNVEIDLVSLDDKGQNKIGIFKSNMPDRLYFIPKPQEEFDPNEYRPINEMTFNVIIAVVDPYVMLKDSATELFGNDRFEGFGIDLIEELSRLYGFKYKFIQWTGGYGSKNNQTGLWDGMIGEVQRGAADLAVADLTINSERILALDFTPSFMNLGIALLYRKPTKEPPSTFSFMSPFSKSVWYLLGTSYILVSLCFFCLGRISASQWENRYPCIEEPTFLENQFTLNNSMWFSAGALLQQGSEIEAKCASIRLASSFWWFFTLIMVSSYTANLATFLVVPNKKSRIESVEELRNCGVEGFECPITFGCKRGGATYTFFKESENELYQNMFRYMEKHPEYMFDDNKDGIDRVYYSGDDHYAFLMESASIDYEVERKCNLTQVGDTLDDKNYGIGMRKNFAYHSQLSEGVLELQEKGVLATLRKKWWKERKGGGACSDDINDEQAVPLEMANVIGVFYVLIVGTLFAIFYGIFDLTMEIRKHAMKHKKEEQGEADELDYENLAGVFLVLLYGTIFAVLYGCTEASFYIYKNAKSQKISFKEELIAEMKFLMTCQGVKQVRHRKGSKSQCSGTSSGRSRFSVDINSRVHGSNVLLNLEQ